MTRWQVGWIGGHVFFESGRGGRVELKEVAAGSRMMPDARTFDSDSLRVQSKRIVGELARMINLRRDLAELEVRSDLRSVRRLAIIGGIGLLLTLTGLPVLVICAARGLEQYWEWQFLPTALTMAAVLVIPGLAMIGRGIAVFRRDFRGLQNSLAELQEDLIWLREWAGDQGPSED